MRESRKARGREGGKERRRKAVKDYGEMGRE